MGATSGQEEAPLLRPRRDRDCDEFETCDVWCCRVFGIALLLTALGLLIMLFRSIRDPPEYSAAISAASGLDYHHATATGLPALDPVFNLTVRITSKSQDEACLRPTTSVQVSYMRVPLAHGRVPPGLCAAPWQSKDVAVVARGEAVVMSRFLVETLAEDVRSGEAVFEVALMSPDGDRWDVITCWDKVGDAKALERPCRLTWVHPKLPVPQPAGT